MWKAVLVGTTAVAIAGSSVALADAEHAGVSGPELTTIGETATFGHFSAARAGEMDFTANSGPAFVIETSVSYQPARPMSAPKSPLVSELADHVAVNEAPAVAESAMTGPVVSMGTTENLTVPPSGVALTARLGRPAAGSVSALSEGMAASLFGHSFSATRRPF